MYSVHNIIIYIERDMDIVYIYYNPYSAPTASGDGDIDNDCAGRGVITRVINTVIIIIINIIVYDNILYTVWSDM